MGNNNGEFIYRSPTSIYSCSNPNDLRSWKKNNQPLKIARYIGPKVIEQIKEILATGDKDKIKKAIRAIFNPDQKIGYNAIGGAVAYLYGESNKFTIGSSIIEVPDPSKIAAIGLEAIIDEQSASEEGPLPLPKGATGLSGSPKAKQKSTHSLSELAKVAQPKP